MFAAAAGLWLVYLMPTWFKRREYLATERNAVRLQQTLRVLAETSEVPAIVRADTSARSVAAHEKALRERERHSDAVDRSRDAHTARSARLVADRAVADRADADRAAAVAAAAAAAAPGVTPRTASVRSGGQPTSPRTASARGAVTAEVARRLRRTRAAASLISLAALVTIAAQLVMVAVTGVGAGTFGVLGFASVAAATGISALVRLASVARRRSAPQGRAQRDARTRTRTRMADFAPLSTPAAPTAPAEWTPVPVPKPLYLSRAIQSEPDVPSGVAVLATAATELRAAAARADELLRVARHPAAQGAPEVAQAAQTADVPDVAVASAEPIPAAIPSGPPSRFSRMGIVDPADVAGPDIDAALRRRRAS